MSGARRKSTIIVTKTMSAEASAGLSHPSLVFRPTRAIYPPIPGQPDPDELIRDIPFPARALSDFQSVPFAQPPKRDVPSIIIAHLSNPQTSGPEPDWILLMKHFTEKRCLDGPGNCQDLYIFVTRIMLPNAIIENRRLLHELYMEKRTLSADIRFRYGNWHTTTANNTYTPLTTEPLFPLPSHPTRPILCSIPTPSGKNFLQWLSLPLNTPPEKRPCPEQLVHRPSALDGYLDEEEGLVRRMEAEALIWRTGKVLGLFWWVKAQSAWLRGYEEVGWEGVEREVGDG